MHKPDLALYTLLPLCVNSKNVLIGSVMCRDCEGLLYLGLHHFTQNIVELQTAFCILAMNYISEWGKVGGIRLQKKRGDNVMIIGSLLPLSTHCALP